MKPGAEVSGPASMTGQRRMRHARPNRQNSVFDQQQAIAYGVPSPTQIAPARMTATAGSGTFLFSAVKTDYRHVCPPLRC
jgi:hypothetical protein